MKELVVKKDFTEIYTQDSPYGYLKEMKKLQYRIANLTKPLYLFLAKHLFNKLDRPLNLVDIGSSYGINSALMRHDLTMSELDDFFLKRNEPTRYQTKQFFEDHTINDNLNFYNIDISRPALRFSEDVGLCKKGIDVNLEKCNVDSLESLPNLDMVIATGCIGYIGHKAFANLFDLVKERKDGSVQTKNSTTPLLAFSVLRIFDMEKIQKTFDDYGYFLVKSDLKPLRQRKFSDSTEKSQTLSLLHSKGIDTKWYEDDGYFYADFYIAGPKIIESQLITLSKNMKRQVEDN